MSDPFEEMLKGVLASLGESVSRAPVGSDTFTSLTAVVNRAETQASHAGNESVMRYSAEIKILASVDATLGGLVAPAVGDRWKVATTRGGALVEGWKASEPTGIRGGWKIRITFDDVYEKGGKRRAPA